MPAHEPPVQEDLRYLVHGPEVQQDAPTLPLFREKFLRQGKAPGIFQLGANAPLISRQQRLRRERHQNLLSVQPPLSVEVHPPFSAHLGAGVGVPDLARHLRASCIHIHSLQVMWPGCSLILRLRPVFWYHPALIPQPGHFPRPHARLCSIPLPGGA